ncbi:MAG: ATP-binding protein [Pseudomonadota bacterium]
MNKETRPIQHFGARSHWGRTGPRPARRLHRSFPATAVEVTAFLSDFILRTGAWTADRARLDDAELVLAEILNNIVEHGSTGPDTMVEITLVFDATRIRAEVVDNGAALPLACLLDSGLPRMEPGIRNLPEGGFGWFMIHQIAGDIAYEHVGGQNRLIFSIPL